MLTISDRPPLSRPAVLKDNTSNSDILTKLFAVVL